MCVVMDGPVAPQGLAAPEAGDCDPQGAGGERVGVGGAGAGGEWV